MITEAPRSRTVTANVPRRRILNPAPEPARKVLIWSEEHGAWWRANQWGYTNAIAEAGRYDRAVATSILTSANLGGSQFNEIAIEIPDDLDALIAVAKKRR